MQLQFRDFIFYAYSIFLIRIASFWLIQICSRVQSVYNFGTIDGLFIGYIGDVLMRRWPLFFLIFLFTGRVAAIANKTEIVRKNIYGYVEKVSLVDNDLVVLAKLDTGAQTASLNAMKITEVVIDGETYLKFLVPTKKGNVLFTCEYAGRVKIKSRVGETKVHSLLTKPIRRPVVKMRMRMNGIEKVILVNLTNRKHFNYPLLLGREAIIAFNGIVDPQLKFTINKKPTVREKNEI